MLFIAAVLVAAWYGGAAMGFVALGLGLLLADTFFISHKAMPWRPEFIETMRAIRYLFTASVGIVVIELLHRAGRRTEAAVHQLEEEILRRQR